MFHNAGINIGNEQIDLKDLFFKFLEIELYAVSSYKTFRRLYAKSFSLIVILEADGQGRISIAGNSYRISSDAVYLCPKGKGFQLHLEEPSSNIKLFLLQFDIVAGPCLKDGQTSYHTVGETDILNEVHLPAIEPLITLCYHIYRQQLSTSGQNLFNCQTHFHTIIGHLLDSYSSPPHNLRSALDQSKIYLENHYNQNIQLADLAAMTNLSTGYYVEKFRQFYGLSPIKYLNELRIRQSKSLLIRPYGKIRDIAQQVGYRDEFYFSRKFKQQVGVTPTTFARRRYQKIAVYQVILIGHLVPLNIIPFAAPLNLEHWPYYYHMLAKDTDIHLRLAGKGWKAELKELCSAEPDLILTLDNISLKEKEQLEQTGARVLYVSEKSDWRQQFLQIAQWLDVQKEGLNWLRTYEKRLAEVKQNLQPWVGQATFLILNLYKTKGYVMRDRSMEDVFLGDLQMQAATRSENTDVTLSDVAAINPDCILMLIFHDPETLATWKKWTNSQQWKDLRAVREQRIYMIDPRPWREYSAYGHYQIVNDVCHLLS